MLANRNSIIDVYNLDVYSISYHDAKYVLVCAFLKFQATTSVLDTANTKTSQRMKIANPTAYQRNPVKSDCFHSLPLTSHHYPKGRHHMNQTLCGGSCKVDGGRLLLLMPHDMLVNLRVMKENCPEIPSGKLT